MSASTVVRDKEQKNDVHLSAIRRNGKKNSIKIAPVMVDKDHSSKTPIVRDGIQKEVVRHELKLHTQWDEKYGHLSGKVFQEILAEEALKAGFPSDTFKRKKPDILTVKHFENNLMPSPPIPKTSLGFVGWRSPQEKYSLEFKKAMYISPKRTVDPSLKPGDTPITHQRFIILG